MNENKLKNLALQGVFWKAAHGNVWLYPAAVHGTGEGTYEKRTERMEGWNAAAFAHTENYTKLIKWHQSVPEEYRQMVTDLLVSGDIDLDIHGDECGMSVNCSDVFWWGCSDCEEIAFSELSELRDCLAQAPGCGDILWCARKRGERPQGAQYSYIKREYWPLFHAAGPERETGMGNPCKPGAYERGPYSDKSLAEPATTDAT